MESDKKGIKFDSNKPDAYLLFQDFPRALKEISKLANMGAHKKYEPHNWQYLEDGKQRYSSALVRHIIEENLSEEYIEHDEVFLHATAVAWNAIARLELILREKENGPKN